VTEDRKTQGWTVDKVVDGALRWVVGRRQKDISLERLIRQYRPFYEMDDKGCRM
jgi:hypothetical protein